MKKSVFSKKPCKISSVKKLVKNRLGMTYVELLTALGLLALIITSFTPMLLSSYETLYDAGVKVQDAYASKVEIEEGLARRDSESSAAIKLNMRVNADALFEQVSVSGRKVISTFQEGLETVFGQIRARIEIVSPSTVYDDTTSHNIILQTFGMEYKKITFGQFNYDTTNEPGAANKMPADQIHIQVIVPNKAAKKSSGTADENMIGTEDELVYSTGRFCEIEYYNPRNSSYKPVNAAGLSISNNDDAGRIKLKIKSPASGDKIDFTYSPLKVKVYYINSRGHLRTVSDYLYIDPPTLLMAGETNTTIDYYTSAGIEAIDVSTSDDPNDKKIEYQLKAEARTMRTSNSAYLYNNGQYDTAIGAPRESGSEIRSIRWIDNDETQGLNSYYVMTGTNGSIYRMYSFSSDKSDIFNAAMGASIYNTSTGFFNAKQNYIDRVYTTDTGRRVYPALWGGDYSHIFEYSSAEQRVAYGPSANYKNDQAWITSAKVGSLERAGLTGDPIFNVMSANAKFCYYYNGDGTAHKYAYKDAKPISYILTERGWPIRLTGIIGPAVPDKDFFEDFAALWDAEKTVSNIRTKTIYNDSSQVLAFHYKYENKTFQSDYSYGGLRIKSLASYAIKSEKNNSTADYFNTDDDYENTTSQAKIKNVRKSNDRDDLDGAANDVNITDVIYIPGTSSTQGSTFYVGNVHAYADIIQTVKIEEGAANHVQYKHSSYKKEKKNWLGQWKYEDKDIDPIEAANLVGQSYDRNTEVPAAQSMVGRYYRNSSKGAFDTDNACSYPIASVSDYLIFSNADGTATYIAKYNDNDYARMSYEQRRDYFQAMDTYVTTYDSTIENATSTNGVINVGGVAIYDGSDITNRTAFFLPKVDMTWDHLYLDDVFFTFGYTSNRERVYTNITYDGTVEYMRSFERLYWRSHYGQDAVYYKESGELNFVPFYANQEAYTGTLLPHQQNRAVSDGNGGLQLTDDYLNSVDNDYYNVWFPGEMYNLNKIASKDGVTVAVGYAVAGSSYQHAMASNTSVTSTALGSIYNDGVLAAMIEGKDDAFVNLLYYKDNETFDNYSLYSQDTTNPDAGTYGQYAEYGSVGYGMHGRDSVQFTAVDLLVENIKSSETATDYTVNYYAYYGDSKGRVFRSLVASASGTGTGAEGEQNASEIGATLVPYISDSPTAAAGIDPSIPSQMVEIVLDNGKTLDNYFSKIVTIDAKDDLIVITGEMRNGVQEYFVVGVRDAATNTMSWRLVSNCGFTSVINDATMVGGYYYIVGNGWLAGVSLDMLRNTTVTALTTPSLTNAGLGCKSTDPNQLLWCSTSVDLYAIAGRDTQ